MQNVGLSNVFVEFNCNFIFFTRFWCGRIDHVLVGEQVGADLESQTSHEVLSPVGGGGGSRRLLVLSLQSTAQSVSLIIYFTILVLI